MKRLSKNEFIEKCLEEHGNIYDYSLVDYKNISTKVRIICKEHGPFSQIAKNHKGGQGCPLCYGDRNLTKEEYIKKYGREEFDYSLLPDIIKIKSIITVIDKSTKLEYKQWADHHKNGKRPTKIESGSLIKKLGEIHGDIFSYVVEKETYHSTDNIKIINKLTTDEFYYRVDRHLLGMKPNKITLKYFLLKSKEINGDKYDYSLIKEIKGGLSKVDIICKQHGVFKQRVSNHINLADGCPKCVGVGKWNNDVLKSEFIKVHSNLYDYSLVEFKGVDKKIKIRCQQHGVFIQNIHKHLKSQGCPRCSFNSKGEEYIKMYLEEFGIKYIRQHSFRTCRYINRLSFDFYLPETNTCVEFDGEQHFKPNKFFGGKSGFRETLKRDKCKNDWCLENSVRLLRIKYDEIDKISYIIKKELLEYKK